MSGAVDHVLITRFNLPSNGVEGVIRAQEGWLRERVRLFEQYCLPSVVAQDAPRFHWMVYFDEQSPDWLMQAMQAHVERGVFIPQLATSVPTSRLLADIRAVVGAPGQYLMTTNLDNDDGLARNFVSRLQAVPPAGHQVAIFLTRGLVRDHERVYLRVDPANAFCTVLEPWTDPETCWADWHTLLPRRMRTIRLSGEPGWLQVVHGNNVSNRVRGHLTDAELVDGLFIGLDDVQRPPRRALVLDRLVVAPGRQLRDVIKTVAKWILLRTIGKSGVERIRLILVRRSSHVPDPPGLE